MNESLTTAIVAFALASCGTVSFGVYITKLADEIADRTRLGRVIIGALLLGALTSISEVGTSVSAALNQHPELAVNNAVGSIAAQTAFIAVADMAYRNANLEHAAASASNLMLVTMLLGLIALVIFGTATPGLSIGPVHPVSFALVIVYVYGMILVARTGALPMWHARKTDVTDEEQDREITYSGSLHWLWTRFVAVAALLVLSGVLLAESGIALASLTGITETFIGAMLTGVASSVPELVTAITAVRIGALSLAISNIIGGNAFDTVILAFSDFSYVKGPILLDAGPGLLPMLSITMLMNVAVLLGMVRRERHGLANIGLEGVVMLALYVGLVVYLFSSARL